MSISDSFRSWLTGTMLLALAVVGGAAQAAPAEDPQAVAQKVYAQIKSNLNVDLSNSLVDQYFDTHSMAVQALGFPYRGFSDEQKTAYVQAFDGYFKKALFRVLTNYKNVTISGLTSRVEGDRANVRCVVNPTNGQPVDLVLNLSLVQGAWRANDVVVDNISLIVSYRPQFDSLFKQSGFSGLITYLNSH
jgi:phospholipid transport system substrate-binding protein